MPASNLKIFTTAAALDLLGPDFQYQTRLEARGRITPEGRLEGPLVIVGSGDPSLGSWHLPDNTDSRDLLTSWTRAIKQAGISEIAGDIIGDGRCFTDQYISNNWELDDIPYWYAAGSSGLCIEENCFRFTTAPGKQVGDKAILTFLPTTAYITVINDIVTTGPGGPQTADIVWRESEHNIIRFAGTVPIDAKPFQQRGSVWDGALYTAALLRETLEREGVRVQGQARNIRSLPDSQNPDSLSPTLTRLLAVYQSPPVKQLVANVNKPSHNFFADHLLRTIGYRIGGKESGSFSGGADVVRRWLGQVGVPEPERFKMLDGSGLSRGNLVEPRQCCALLRAIYQSKTPDAGAAFYESLPIAGVDGDLKNRMKDPPLKGNVHAKTGYIGQVRSLSGYVNDADGDLLVFSMIINQQSAPGYNAPDRLIDAACALLAQYRQ